MYKKTALLLLGVTLISCSPSNNSETTTSSSINEEKIEIHTVFSRLNDISKENFLEFSFCSSGIATIPYTINETHYINSKEKYESLMLIKNSYLTPADEDYYPMTGGTSIIYSFTYSKDEEINKQKISIQNGYIYLNKSWYKVKIADEFNFESEYSYLHFNDTTPNEIDVYDYSSNEKVITTFNFDDIEFIEIDEQNLTNNTPRFFSETGDNIYYYSNNEFSFTYYNVRKFFKVVSDKNFYFFE